MSVVLEDGFKKADSSNIPQVTAEMVFTYIAELTQTNNKEELTTRAPPEDSRVCFVQIKRKDVCELKGRIFYPDSDNNTKYAVSIQINERLKKIISILCENCSNDYCPHSVDFLFWAHRRSSDINTPEIKLFWDAENDEFPDDMSTVIKMKDIFNFGEVKGDSDLYVKVSEEDGNRFLNSVLDQLEKSGLTDTPLYRHCRPVVDNFEPIYIHHTMLDNAHNTVRDHDTFINHMKLVAGNGLFAEIQEASITQYRKSIWMETQYCRIRCSLIHRVANREQNGDSEELLNAVFCTNREWNIEEKQQLKERKRQILRETKALHEKEYNECGLLLNTSYPYMCASPDGICDDHIIEIKVPKTKEDFEKYLSGKQTITPKYMAQIQIQMYFANVSKALFCVLSPSFEANKCMYFIWVPADLNLICSLLTSASSYWENVVFPKIKKIYIDK